MNERMIELYKQAAEFAYGACKEEGRQGGPGDHIWHTLSTGRFAELIVRECSEVSLDQWCENGEHESAQNTILKHFGIE